MPAKKRTIAAATKPEIKKETRKPKSTAASATENEMKKMMAQYAPGIGTGVRPIKERKRK